MIMKKQKMGLKTNQNIKRMVVIQLRKFTNSFPGYNKGEVNSFVQNVTTEYESMLNNLKDRDKEIESLKQELSRYKNLENTLNRAILIAEESSQNIKKSSIEEGRVIVEEAKRNASRIINNALIRAEKVETEATKLQKQVRDYKRKYKDLLEEQLNDIERMEIDKLVQSSTLFLYYLFK